ncbi:hypothetical protein ACFYN3_28365 [Streptomyces lavendulae]|uniref:hypothetical protein n=1 Tax=Streptomyces lavendulae TaxID=1914 RepID=UPI003678EEFE
MDEANAQQAQGGEKFGKSVSVRAVRADSSPVAALPVAFSIVRPDTTHSSLSNLGQEPGACFTVVSDTEGLASVDVYAGDTPGLLKITAEGGGQRSEGLTETVVPTVASGLVIFDGDGRRHQPVCPTTHHCGSRSGPRP